MDTALLQYLFAFALEMTGLPDPGSLPEFEILPHAVMVSRVCSEEFPDSKADFWKCYQGLKWSMSFYKLGYGTVLLAKECDPETNTECQAQALHEIVHYLQDKAGLYEDRQTKHACLVFRNEYEAYRVQTAFMEENGLHPRYVNRIPAACNIEIS